jgi:hypothetical protein
LSSLRRGAAALGIASLVAGCPAFVFDPPYRAVAEDASMPHEADAAPDIVATPSHDAAVTIDAPSEATAIEDGEPPEAAPGDGAPAPYDSGCAGVICNGVCMAGSVDCASCSGMTNLCLATGTCVSSCSGCDDGGVICLLCADGGSPAGAAIGCGDGCFAGTYSHCGCGTNAATCAVTVQGTPLANQTCANGGCSTCGEPPTDGKSCSSGKCMPGARTPACFRSSSACSCM